MSEDHLDPEAEARVRALLADLAAAPDRALPPEVAARLDQTVAELAARHAGQHTGQHTDTALGRLAPTATGSSRRSRTTWWAAAAAAVVVLGAGGVAAARLGHSGGEHASSDSAGSAAAGSAASAPTPGSALDATALPSLHAATFAADAARLVRTAPALAPPAARTAGPGSASAIPREPKNGLDALRASGCTGPRITDGAAPQLVQYDGAPAVLLVHPARLGVSVVEAWSCDGRTRLDVARLSTPAPVTGGGGASPGTSPGGTPRAPAGSGLATASPTPSH